MELHFRYVGGQLARYAPVSKNIYFMLHNHTLHRSSWKLKMKINESVTI